MNTPDNAEEKEQAAAGAALGCFAAIGALTVLVAIFVSGNFLTSCAHEFTDEMRDARLLREAQARAGETEKRERETERRYIAAAATPIPAPSTPKPGAWMWKTEGALDRRRE